MDITRASLLLRIKDGGDAAGWREAEDVVQHRMAAIHEYICGFDYDPTSAEARRNHAVALFKMNVLHAQCCGQENRAFSNARAISGET